MIAANGAHRSGRPWWRLCAVSALAAVVVLFAGSTFAPNTGAEQERLIITLDERNDSGVTGEATLVDEDGLSVATITVSSGIGPYLPYLRRGSCKTFRESPAIPLALASAEAPSTTTIDVPLTELTGSYVIALYELGGDFDALRDPVNAVACGWIAGVEGSATTITPPVSGVGFPKPGVPLPNSLSIACGAFAFLFGYLGIRQNRPLAAASPPQQRANQAQQRLERYLT